MQCGTDIDHEPQEVAAPDIALCEVKTTLSARAVWCEYALLHIVISEAVLCIHATATSASSEIVVGTQHCAFISRQVSFA